VRRRRSHHVRRRQLASSCGANNATSRCRLRIGSADHRNGSAEQRVAKRSTKRPQNRRLLGLILLQLSINPVRIRETTTRSVSIGQGITSFSTNNGRPLTKESFGNLFRKACREAGLQNRSAHGLRKAAATRAAENGATVAQLNAIFGWKGAKMTTLYTEAADRRRLSLDAMHLLANDK